MARSQDDVVTLVQQLLNKTTERGATEEEAASAVAKVQQLLTAHNLSMADVEAKDEVVEPEVIEIRDFMRKGEGKPWLVKLCNSVAHANYCRVIHTYLRASDLFEKKSLDGKDLDEKTLVMCYIGRPVNAQFCQQLSHWLEHTIWDNVVKDRKRFKLRGGAVGNYLRGMVDRVCMRLAEEHRRQQERDGKVTALTIQYAKENTKLIKKLYPVLGRSRTSRTNPGKHYNSYALGFAAGKNISLSSESRQIEGE